MRIVESLGFVREIVRKMSIAVLSRLPHKGKEVGRALTQGMQIQTLAIGLPLLAFGAVLPWFIRLVLGNAWQPIIALYPFVAVFFCASSIFQLHVAALNVLGLNAKTALFNGAQAAVVLLSAAWFLSMRGDLSAYGFALLCGLPIFIMIDIFFAQSYTRPDYGIVMVWAVCFAAAVFAPLISYWLLLAAFVPFFVPRSRARALEAAQEAWTVLFRKRTSLIQEIET
jgi:PST family polysaccharide transporter